MAKSGERRVLIAMDGSSYADYAFDGKNNFHLSFLRITIAGSSQCKSLFATNSSLLFSVFVVIHSIVL